MKKIRESIGLTQQDLADLIGCNRSCIALAEKKQRNLAKAHLEILYIIENYLPASTVTRVRHDIAIKIENPTLERQLRKNSLSYRKKQLQLESLIEKKNSVSKLLNFLESIKDEKIISEKLEYSYKYRVASSKMKQIVINIQNILIEMASLKAAMKKIKSYYKK